MSKIKDGLIIPDDMNYRTMSEQKPTPKLTRKQFAKFQKELEANRGNKVSATKRKKMKTLLQKVLSNKK